MQIVAPPEAVESPRNALLLLKEMACLVQFGQESVEVPSQIRWKCIQPLKSFILLRMNLPSDYQTCLLDSLEADDVEYHTVEPADQD